MEKYSKLEEEVLKKRQIEAASENGQYKEEAINAIYRDWSDRNPSGALAIEANFEKNIETKKENLELEAYNTYMEIGEETNSFFPYAAAAVTAKNEYLPEELYKKAVYRLGKETTGMERREVEKTYGIEINDIRNILSERAEKQKEPSNLKTEPAY